MIYFKMTDEHEAEAKRITREDDKKYGKRNFEDPKDDRWTGKIGEIALKTYLPRLIPSPEVASQFDFYHQGLQKKLEVKTNSYRNDTNLKYHALLIELEQYKRNESRIFVFCYYDLSTKYLYLMGWIDRDAIELQKVIILKGNKVNSEDYMRSFTAKADNIQVKHMDLHNIKELK